MTLHRWIIKKQDDSSRRAVRDLLQLFLCCFLCRSTSVCAWVERQCDGHLFLTNALGFITHSFFSVASGTKLVYEAWERIALFHCKIKVSSMTQSYTGLSGYFRKQENIHPVLCTFLTQLFSGCFHAVFHICNPPTNETAERIWNKLYSYRLQRWY